MSKNLEVDCTRKCKSRRHGQALTGAITKRSISDDALASYIKATCANFLQAFDSEGRTALHMSASRGRTRLAAWLARHSLGAFANARDRESGYTPLHRSVFYGQIHSAVALMKLGVNTDILDKDDYRALEHATLDRHYMGRHDAAAPSDVYVWGTNCNYTLGTGSQEPRHAPEALACFSRTNTCITQVCLGKFHSVWVCAAGGVWAGGAAARAGAGAGAGTLLRPAPLRAPEACARAALLLDATVLLTRSGAVLQYGLSSSDAPPVAKGSTLKLPSIKPLLKLSQPLGLCSGRGHAVVWSRRAVYTWGANWGQLGHSPEDKVVATPKRVAISMNNNEEAGIQLVDAGDAATVIATSRGDVYLLHKHICKKIAIKQINLRQVCVEAKVSEQGVPARATVLLLTGVGQLLLWQDATNRLTRCVFGLNHQTIITNVALTHDALYFTTKYGEAFVGYISRKTTPTQPQPIRKEKERDNNKSALVKFLEKDDCTSVRIVKIPNIHRAVSIVVDSEGMNFACLQTKPTCGLTSLPELSASGLPEHMAALMEAAAPDDMLHDVVFKVGAKLYPAHMFIIATSSDHLYRLYQEHISSEDAPVISLDIHPEVFERILRYMYTGACDVSEPGPCSLRVRREDLPGPKKEKEEPELDFIENASEISAFEAYKYQESRNKKCRGRRSADTPPRPSQHCDPVRLVQAAARRLHVAALQKLLDRVYYRDGMIHLKESFADTKSPPLHWERSSFPELVDTHVSTKDGALVPAHKCILAARLEYFHGMFTHSWTESKMSSKVTLPINHGILLPVIDFLYTDSCPEVENSDSIDFICSMLIVADQLFVTRLREMCEVALSNLVTLKNCTELCQFAHTYNATQLKKCCMEFISLNLSNILESRSLEDLEEALLEDISEYYCKFNPIMASRIITPFFNAPDDETINDLAKSFPVDLSVTDDDLKKDDRDSVIEINKKKKSKKIEYTESEKTRMRYESVSSITSLDISNENSGDVTLSLSKISLETEKNKEKKDKWIEVPSAQQKQQKVVQARLKALSSAKDILNESPVESFTKLTKNNSSSAINTPESIPASSRMSVSPKESPIAEMAWGSPGILVINHVGPKLSQKQRKKLALQGNDQSPQNLNQFLNSKVVGSPPEQPRNPWKIVNVPVASSSPKQSKAMEFNQILADQKKQKDDSSRIMTKPLLLTQLEDKAIEDLERFYNIHEMDDELITVRRIELKVSSPQWVHTAPK